MCLLFSIQTNEFAIGKHRWYHRGGEVIVITRPQEAVTNPAWYPKTPSKRCHQTRNPGFTIWSQCLCSLLIVVALFLVLGIPGFIVVLISILILGFIEIGFSFRMLLMLFCWCWGFGVWPVCFGIAPFGLRLSFRLFVRWRWSRCLGCPAWSDLGSAGLACAGLLSSATAFSFRVGRLVIEFDTLSPVF